MVRLMLPFLIWITATWLPTICMMACAVGQTHGQQFPYVAFVAEAEVYVRSGPGQKYYPTQQLAKGFAVEVYRHDDAGWCAIRPPAGSFSWVPAHQIHVVSQTVAEVAAEGVVTRIGSMLSPARSTVQVLLPRDERVELLAGQPTDNPDWLRVAAPAGEFRWIAAKHLSLQPPIEAAPPVPSSSGWSNQSPHTAVLGTSTLETSTEKPPTAFQHLQDSQSRFQGIKSFPAEAPANYSPNHDPNAIDVVTGSPAEMQLAQFQPPAEGLVSPTLLGQPSTAANAPFSSPPRIRFRGISSSEGSTLERLGELQLRLSQTVIQPPEEWRFEQLQSEANALLEKTQSTQVRSQLRDLLDRIARFQRVRQGYEGGPITSPDSLTDTGQPTPLEAAGLTGLTSKVRELAKTDLTASRIATITKETSGSTTDKPLYDAVGLLKPVASKRANAPQYALVDDKGGVVSFITPTPDLNLKPYIGHRIGVHGKRGFMSEYRRAHVTAERISPIGDRIRR